MWNRGQTESPSRGRLAIFNHTVLPTKLPPDTSEHTPLTPARHAGTRFTYPGGMEG